MEYHYVHSLGGISKQVCTNGATCTRSHCKYAHPNVNSRCQHSKWCLHGPLHGTVNTPACTNRQCVFNHFIDVASFADYRSGDFNRRKKAILQICGVPLMDETDSTPVVVETSINPYEASRYHYIAYMTWYNHAIACVKANNYACYEQNFNAAWYHYKLYINWHEQTLINIPPIQPNDVLYSLDDLDKDIKSRVHNHTIGDYITNAKK